MQISPKFGAKLVFATNTEKNGKPTSDKQGHEEAKAFEKMLTEALPKLDAYPDMTLYVHHNFAYSRPEGSNTTTRHNMNSTAIMAPGGTVSVSRKDRWLFGPEPLKKYLKKILAAAHEASKLKPKAQPIATPPAAPVAEKPAAEPQAVPAGNLEARQRKPEGTPVPAVK